MKPLTKYSQFLKTPQSYSLWSGIESDTTKMTEHMQCIHTVTNLTILLFCWVIIFEHLTISTWVPKDQFSVVRWQVE